MGVDRETQLGRLAKKSKRCVIDGQLPLPRSTVSKGQGRRCGGWVVGVPIHWCAHQIDGRKPHPSVSPCVYKLSQYKLPGT